MHLYVSFSFNICRCLSFVIYIIFAFIIRLFWCRLCGGTALWLGASMWSYMYCRVVLHYSPCDNLPSVPAFGYNSIQRPVIIVSISNYCFYFTFLECFPDLPSLSCNRVDRMELLFLVRSPVYTVMKVNMVVIVRYLGADCHGTGCAG